VLTGTKGRWQTAGLIVAQTKGCRLCARLRGRRVEHVVLGGQDFAMCSGWQHFVCICLVKSVSAILHELHFRIHVAHVDVWTWDGDGRQQSPKTSGMRALHTGPVMVKSQVEFVGIALKIQSSGSGRKTAKVERVTEKSLVAIM
jgi:hypothetical protein